MTWPSPAPRHTKPATVLLVDDEKVVAEVYCLGLGRAGYDVLMAGSGQAALALARTTNPDFIFLDMMLPGMSGIEVLSQLSEDAKTRGIPVVMLSNYDDPGLIEQSRLMGAKEYVVKAGRDPAELAAMVSRWLDLPAETTNGADHPEG